MALSYSGAFFAMPLSENSPVLSLPGDGERGGGAGVLVVAVGGACLLVGTQSVWLSVRGSAAHSGHRNTLARCGGLRVPGSRWRGCSYCVAPHVGCCNSHVGCGVLEPMGLKIQQKLLGSCVDKSAPAPHKPDLSFRIGRFARQVWFWLGVRLAGVRLAGDPFWLAWACFQQGPRLSESMIKT